jgi:hypothetical protein
MKQLSDLGVRRIGAAIQNVCANVDFDVLSLPGGSLIAVLLWLYASAAASTGRASRPARGSTTAAACGLAGSVCDEGSLVAAGNPRELTTAG